MAPGKTAGAAQAEPQTCSVVAAAAADAERGEPGMELRLRVRPFPRSDNGPEFVSHALLSWITQQGIDTALIDPGKPGRTAGESFNGKFRNQCLNLEWFRSRAEARVVIETWRRHYNRASEHPSGYVIEEKRLCWSGCDPAGYFGFCRARSVIDLAADVVRTARAKIQGPSGKGWIAPIFPASAASRSVFGAISRSCAALPRLSHGSIPSSAGLNTGIR
jgi:hypothetical protein